METGARRRAVCVGINDYPGSFNDLSGCVNDANDWAEVLQGTFGFNDISMILDAQATRDAMLQALKNLVIEAGPGDVLAFTYSGHGTWEYDQPNGDEADNRDEALCAHDGNILDDELREILTQIHPEAFMTIISDSCHSGSVTRSQLARRERGARSPENHSEYTKARYMPPENDLDAYRVPLLPIRQRVMYPESSMPTLLLTGCNALEYSYDAYINGRYNGAMTAMALLIMRNEPQLTYREFHNKLRILLPSTQYPQSPQCEGSDTNKDRQLFTL